MFFQKHRVNGVVQNVQGTVFDDALEKKLYENIEKKGCPHPPLMPTRLRQIVDLIRHKLDAPAQPADTGFGAIKRNPHAMKADHSDAFLVRVEKKTPHGAGSCPGQVTSDQWVERSESEVNLHILLQSRFRALNVGSPDAGDSIRAADLMTETHRNTVSNSKRSAESEVTQRRAGLSDGPSCIPQHCGGIDNPSEPFLHSYSFSKEGEGRQWGSQNSSATVHASPSGPNAAGAADRRERLAALHSHPLNGFERPETPLAPTHTSFPGRESFEHRTGQAEPAKMHSVPVPDMIVFDESPPQSPRAAVISDSAKNESESQRLRKLDARPLQPPVQQGIAHPFQAATGCAPIASEPHGFRKASSATTRRLPSLEVKASNNGQYQFHDLDKANGVFSNFWSANEIMIGCEKWKTVEHYFQAQKFRELDDDTPAAKVAKSAVREAIKNAASPNATKRIAREPHAYIDGLPPIKIDWKEWDQVKVPLMYRAVFEKFSQDTDLKKVLLDTGNAALIETMPSGRDDVFWGAVRGDGGTVTGANMLGQILMQVRSDLGEARTSTNPDAICYRDKELTW